MPPFAAIPRAITAADQAPSCAGAYVLVIDLEAPLPVALPGRAPACLPAGRYLYCGSARGPGGLRARLARHMRRDKRPHWHVDRLTGAGRVAGAWIVPGGDECALVAALADLPMPMPGFGATDCRHCQSHLLRLPVNGSAAGAAMGRWPGGALSLKVVPTVRIELTTC